MDYLQYLFSYLHRQVIYVSFKPCYKWITFNIKDVDKGEYVVSLYGFKPCYKWITFNIIVCSTFTEFLFNPCFKPCYKWITFNITKRQ